MSKYVFPVPPLLNRLYRISGRRIYKAGNTNRYHTECFYIAKQYGLKCTGDWLEVEMEWYRARRIGDVDAVLKAFLDALEGIIWENDSQVQKLTITKRHDKDNPRIEMSFKKFGVPDKKL